MQTLLTNNLGLGGHQNISYRYISLSQQLVDLRDADDLNGQTYSRTNILFMNQMDPIINICCIIIPNKEIAQLTGRRVHLTDSL